jgi:type IV secretory pathway protease TraF
MKGRRFAIGVLSVGVVIAGAGEAAYLAGLRINTTPSMPVGLWALLAPETVLVHGQSEIVLKHGQVVSICPDAGEGFQLAKARGYVPPGPCAGD